MGSPTRAAIPNGQFAGRLIEFSDPELDRKYPRGVYVDLHGYPNFSVYARQAVNLCRAFCRRQHDHVVRYFTCVTLETGIRSRCIRTDIKTYTSRCRIYSDFVAGRLV